MIARQAASWAMLLLAMLTPCAAFADAEAEFKHGLLAYENRKFAEASQHADAGYLEKKLPKLLFLKALSVFRLGRLDEAWSLYQLIQPKELPENMRDLFVSEYAATEQAVRQADVANGKAAADAKAAKAVEDAEVARAKATESARAARRAKAKWLWLGTGGGALLGGGLVAAGLLTASGAGALNLADASTHSDYHSKYSMARGEYYAGWALVGVGVGLGVWAALETVASAQEPRAAVSPVWLDGGAGLAVAGRF